MITTIKLINTSITLEDLNIHSIWQLQLMANEDIWYFGLMHQSFVSVIDVNQSTLVQCLGKVPFLHL